MVCIGRGFGGQWDFDGGRVGEIPELWQMGEKVGMFIGELAGV